MSAINEIVRDILDRDKTNRERRALLEEFWNLSDRDTVTQYLLDLVEIEEDNDQRAWVLSLLAAVNNPDTIKKLIEHLDSKKETYDFARYWALNGLAKSRVSNLKDILEVATTDQSRHVRALAYRLLIEEGEKDYIEKLDNMIKHRDWRNRRAGCRVLRSQAEVKPLSATVENHFFPILVRRLHDNDELMDVKRQAAFALGNMHHLPLKAIGALFDAIKELRYEWTRRSCVDSLVEINKPEIRHALLYTLKDSNAEIRVRSAKGLKNSLGARDAIEFLVGETLKEEAPNLHFISALRRIDNSVAAVFLSEMMRSTDPVVSQRASTALVLLGGEEAHRTLMRKREEAIDKYTELLKDADDDIRRYFRDIMTRAHEAFNLSMFMHRAIFLLGMIMLVGSFYISISSGFGTFEKYVGMVGVGGSLTTLIAIFYRGPLSNIERSITALLEVNVIFQGYMRQMNQIDATFKQLYLAPGGFSIGQLKETVTQIQVSVSKTMEKVRTYLSPVDESK